MEREDLVRLIDQLLTTGEMPQYSADFIMKITKRYIDANKYMSIEADLPNRRYFIVGDIHGDYESLVYIVRFIGTFNTVVQGKGACTVFLGDYIDRGPNSIEVLVTLVMLSYVYPDMFMLLRGNHENGDLNELYSQREDVDTLKKECLAKYGQDTGDLLFDRMVELFDYLRVSCRISDAIYCIHGGVPTDIDGFEKEIRCALPVMITDEDKPQLMSALWNDPMDDYVYDEGTYEKSQRGSGIFCFGKKPTETFLKTKDVRCIVRGHEVLLEPQKNTPDMRVVTIFSSINYWKNVNCQRTYANILYYNDVQDCYDGDNKIQCLNITLKDTVDWRCFDRQRIQGFPPFKVLRYMVARVDEVLSSKSTPEQESTRSVATENSTDHKTEYEPSITHDSED